MHTKTVHAATTLLLTFALVGCGSSGSIDGGGTTQQLSKQLSSEQCTAAGGIVIGDPGNGSVYRLDYRCPNGQAPLGTIFDGMDKPIATEGAVCCGGE